MRSLFLLIGLALVVAEDQLELAAPCDESLCKLPDCRCSSFEIPGGLRARDIPQFVTVTFDDAVNVINILNYRETLYNRVNSNGCKAGATFYVSHEYTDYTLVNELYNQGYQIALHSITHMTNQTYWREASYDEIRLEFVDQRAQIAQFANIPASAISGVRIPYLQLNGNNSFRVIKDYDLGYDCSWPSNSFSSSPLWPYTLDYASIQDCPIPPCPTASIPGAWVQPMVSWVDLNGFPCSMVDACIFAPDHQDADAWFRFIVQNFERHYLNNRAPFGFYIHEAFFQAHPAVKTAFIKFLDLINNLHDVFMVNSNEVIDWVKNPVPIEEYRSQACRSTQFTPCFNRSCGPLRGDHNVWLEYYMQLCATTCPSVYPWLGNPFGL